MNDLITPQEFKLLKTAFTEIKYEAWKDLPREYRHKNNKHFEEAWNLLEQYLK